MKAYVCDACQVTISNPYKQKMREFYVGCSFELEGVFPVNTKAKRTVHLCDECYRALRQIARRIEVNS